MIVILRILFLGALIFVLNEAATESDPGAAAGDMMPAYYFAATVILCLLTAIVWAPFFGGAVSAPFETMYVRGEHRELKNWSLKIIRWLEARGHRRSTLVLCFLEGINRPWLPGVFAIGLANARRGSWLEKVFAKELFRFDNAQNALWAYRVLRRHGCKPRVNGRPELSALIYADERKAAPERPPIDIPPAAEPPPLKRSSDIRLFEGSASGEPREKEG